MELNRKNIVKSIVLLLLLNNIFCSEPEGADIKTKKMTMYRVACHEDYWIEKVNTSNNKIFASSTLESSKYNYEVQNLLDNNKETCWCPIGSGVGEFIIFKIPYQTKGIRIANGLQKNKELFYNNNRVNEIYVGIISVKYYQEKAMEEYDVCQNTKYELQNITYSKKRYFLKDTYNSQDIIFFAIDTDEAKDNTSFWNFEAFTRSKQEIYLVLGIESIYKGKKFNDTCISEIELIK